MLSRGFAAFRDDTLRETNMSKFRDALLTEVMPQVEKTYRVSASRNRPAIAGLSMGGAESLYTGLNASIISPGLALSAPAARLTISLPSFPISTRKPIRNCACYGSPAAPTTG